MVFKALNLSQAMIYWDSKRNLIDCSFLCDMDFCTTISQLYAFKSCPFRLFKSQKISVWIIVILIDFGAFFGNEYKNWCYKPFFSRTTMRKVLFLWFFAPSNLELRQCKSDLSELKNRLVLKLPCSLTHRIVEWKARQFQN